MYGRSVGGLLAIPAMLAMVIGVIWWAGRNVEVAAALPVMVVLMVLTVPLVLRAVAAQEDPVIRRVILLLFPLKILAALARYYIAFEVYGGQADAALYHDNGILLAQSFREGVFAVDTGRGNLSTGAVRYVTGLLYAGAGPTIIGAFMVWAWLAAWGQYGFLRGFQIALPDGNHRRYAVLVLLLPSMLYWPSSLGKESLVVAGLGLAVAGAGRVYAGQVRGLPFLLAGLTLTAVIRPHVGLIAATALVMGYVLKGIRSRSTGGRPLNPVVFVLGAAVLIAAFFPLVSTAQNFLGLDAEDGDTTTQIQEVLEFRGGQTETGGSEFSPVVVNSPLRLPAGAFTVLFRPMPNEARNLLQLATSLESLMLLVLALRWLRPLQLPGRISRQPMLLAAVVFVLAFVVAFSIMGNFGILARQRVQVLPWLLMLLCAYAPGRSETSKPGDSPVQAAHQS
ncbi:MAG TPA: hypothetical protein VMM13_08175 [Euzebya sp.]|nr:hypothetical protein [Euzebya sp.]